MPELMTSNLYNLESTADPLLPSSPASGAGGVGIVAILLRRWKLLAVCALFSAALGFVVGERFCLKTWQAEGTLLFSPYPVPDTLRGIYNPPSSQTLITLVKSPNNLEQLRHDFDLEVPVKVLDRQFKVTQPQNAEMVTVTLDWAEPNAGAAMINRLMELHIRHIADLRKAKVAESLRNLDESLERSGKKLAKARKAYGDFETRVGIFNIPAEASRLDLEISSQEQSLAIPRTALRNLLGQQAKLEEYVDSLATGSARAVQPPQGNNGDRPIEARRTALRDLIQTNEFKFIESTKEYESKLQTYSKLKAHARLRIVSKADLEKAKLELDLARIRRDNTAAAIEKFKAEIKTLPMAFAELRRSDLRQQIAATRLEIVSIEQSIAAKRKEARRMTVLAKQVEPLLKAVKDAEEEKALLQLQLQTLDRMNRQEATEFVIETPAVPLRHATRSNRKKLTLATFSLPMLLLIGGIMMQERRATLARYLHELKGS
jgi:hypothetical protein